MGSAVAVPLSIPIVPCHRRRQESLYTSYLTSQPKATSESKHRHDAGNSRAGQCHHMEKRQLGHPRLVTEVDLAQRRIVLSLWAEQTRTTARRQTRATTVVALRENSFCSLHDICDSGGDPAFQGTVRHWRRFLRLFLLQRVSQSSGSFLGR